MRAKKFSEKIRSSAGYSLLELLMVISISTVMMGIGIVSLKEMANPSQSGAAALASFMKEARARAISTTSAYTVTAESVSRVVAGTSTSCGEATTPDPSLILNLPDQVNLTDISWDVCFNSRGFPDADLTIATIDDYDQTNTIEIFLGGAVRFE